MFFLAATLVGWIGEDFVYRKVAAKNIFLVELYWAWFNGCELLQLEDTWFRCVYVCVLLWSADGGRMEATWCQQRHRTTSGQQHHWTCDSETVWYRQTTHGEFEPRGCWMDSKVSLLPRFTITANNSMAKNTVALHFLKCNERVEYPLL